MVRYLKSSLNAPESLAFSRFRSRFRSRFTSSSSEDEFSSHSPRQEEDLMTQLIQLQKSSGEFQWGNAIEVALDMNQDQIKGANPEVEEGVWVTILVICFLEKKMLEEKELWELVVDKAIKFIQGKVSSQKAEEIKEAAMKIVR